jgi:hypothetical protein
MTIFPIKVAMYVSLLIFGFFSFVTVVRVYISGGLLHVMMSNMGWTLKVSLSEY